MQDLPVTSEAAEGRGRAEDGVSILLLLESFTAP